MVKILNEKEIDTEDYVCGYPIQGTTLFTGEEFDEFMKKAIEEASNDEQ